MLPLSFALQHVSGEQNMVNALGSHGSLAVGVDANNWQFYDGKFLF
jgi:hypothetical protein